MEASFEVEDDVFFADLSKQISLLIMDDDDDEESLVHCPSVNIQAFTQAISPSTQARLLGHDQQSQIRREMSKGTGVFIPRSMTNQRRNNNTKQGRFNANYKYQRPNLDYHNSRMIVPHLKHNNNNVNPSYDSINNP
ncbi:uncharacterized protein [Primulina huaijiensis]|uniref:uncharacterized protein n=1 Tax=Primulina huaijiensis TaxID=1492673 RepID=UPI003CC706F3